jgi:hypothetical protein
MLRWFPSSSCYCMLLMQPSRLKLINISPLLRRPLNYLTFQIIISVFINQEIKIPQSLSEISTAYHTNVFTPILFLSEGRAGIAWEPSNDKMLFLPPPRVSHSLHDILFHFFNTLSQSYPYIRPAFRPWTIE